jgi:thiamine transport system ATP-binding protein
MSLRIEDVSVSFDGREVLSHLDLEVASGETVALLGPSGSGKSTLLMVVTGTLHPDHGRVSIDGHDVTRLPTHRRGVGLVFQDEQLFPHMSVGENIAYGLRVGTDRRLRRDRLAIEARVGEMLDLVGMRDFRERRVTDLSGGEAKRIALARALAPSPRVLLLDEPLTGLDSDLHARLVGELRGLLADTTAVYVTHDRREAAAVADRVQVLAELQH